MKVLKKNHLKIITDVLSDQEKKLIKAGASCTCGFYINVANINAPWSAPNGASEMNLISNICSIYKMFVS